MWLKIFFVAIFCVSKIFSSPSGAPLSACTDMTPRHSSFEPQTTDLPVKIEVPELFPSLQPISIKIISTSIESFRGFKIQARNNANGELIGTFQSNDVIGVLDCDGIPNSAATHRNNNPKNEIEIIWEPPMTTDIILFNFFVTIVERHDTFWVRARTQLLAVIPSELVPTTTDEVTTLDTTTNDPGIDAIYDGCGVDKTCFGIPNLCYLNKNCDLLGAVTYDSQNSIFTFEILSTNTHNYVAMGLSTTRNMGSSSVIECVQLSGISAFTSWTVGTSGAERSNVDQNIIDLIEGSLINGRIYCKVQRLALSVVRGNIFDLINNRFYLLLAGGPDVNVNSVHKHVEQGISYGTVLLTNPENVSLNKSTSIMILIHGSFMIVAWIGLTSIGVVFARYFKKLWSNGGYAAWFIWHVFCMSLSWALTIAGFVIIFVDRGEWRTSAHAIMGCIVLGFTVLQPIGALFRPEPESKERPLFNWLHKAFGSLTHVLAIITIFFAVGFPQAGLPNYTLYILAAFVSFYLLMHIIFQSILICGEMKTKKDSRPKSSTVVPYHLIQKTLLGIYIISIVAFVIALLLVLNLDFDT